MKKIFLSLFLVITLFMITSCGKENDNLDSNSGDSVLEHEQHVNDDIELYSDDTKYVFEMGNTKYVFYYEGDTITAYHTYVNYGDSRTARYTYNFIKKEDYPVADKYYVQGKYLVFEWNKSEYQNLKASTLRQAYSYMKEVKKNS